MTNIYFRPISRIVTFSKGKPPSQLPYYGPDAVPYLTPEYLRGKSSFEYAKPNPNAALVENGDTIVLWDGSNAGEIFLGRAGLLASTMSLVSHSEDFDRGYFFYSLKKWEPYLKGQTSGSGIPHVDKEIIGKLELCFLPLTEQHKIAHILSTIDRAIEQTEAMIAKQQRIKSGLLQDLLTRGIDEQGNLRSEKTHQFKDSPLGRIPVEWGVVNLSHFVKDLIAGVSVNSDDRPCGANEIGILKTSAISKGQFYADENKTILSSEIFRASTAVVRNTILISRMNTPDLVGESGFVDRDYPHLFLPDRIWMTSFVKGKELGAKWLSYVISSENTRRYISLHATGTSGSMKNLSKNSMLTMPIKAPMQMDEQIRISKVLDNHQLDLYRLDKSANKLKLLKTALMQDLLTGRKRVAALLQEKEMVST